MSLETTVPSAMEPDPRTGLSVWAIIAIACNAVVGVLILILFGIIYKACKVPSHQDTMPVFTAMPEKKKKKKKKKPEQKYLLTAA